jgi:hypothetical protein
MHITDIRNNDDNPRYIKDANFNKLCKSIQSFPKMLELRPIIINEDNVIIGGNMRYKALVQLGYQEIPDQWVKQVNDMTPEQVQEFIIKDNLPYGEWDWDELANNWDEDKLIEWGLDIPHFDPPTKEEQDEELSSIQDGDVYKMGNHILICSELDNKQHIINWVEQGRKAFTKLAKKEIDLLFITTPQIGQTIINQVSEEFPKTTIKRIHNIEQ